MAPGGYKIFIGLLTVIFLGLSSAQTDRLDCKDVECPDIICPADSIYKSYNQQIHNNDQKKIIQNSANSNNNDDDDDGDDLDGLVDNGEIPRVPEDHNQRHINNFQNYYVEKSSDSDAQSNNEHVLAKRSLQYKRRESIKIVPGDYISLVPEAGGRSAQVEVHQHKWKRDLEDDEEETRTQKNEVTTVKVTKPSNASMEECCGKCVCSGNCVTPDCWEFSKVPVEISSSSQNPGRCCAKFECLEVPICSKVINSPYYWVTKCRTCHCVAGAEICHEKCGEDHESPSNCLSTILGRSFPNGATWKDDPCTHCKCDDGEMKCQTSFCKDLECPNKIKLDGECCPFCAPNATILETSSVEPLPTENSTSKTVEIDEITTTPVIVVEIETTSPASTSIASPTASGAGTTSTTQSPPPAQSPAPCQDNSSIASRTSEKIEKIEPEKTSYWPFYLIIAILSAGCFIFGALYFHERTKKRSYRSVPSFDSNLNKLPTPIASA